MRDWERVSGKFLGNLFQPPQQGKFCPAPQLGAAYGILGQFGLKLEFVIAVGSNLTPTPTHHVDPTQETHRRRLARANGRRSNGASGRPGRRSEPDTQGHAFEYDSRRRVRGSRGSPRHVAVFAYEREPLAPEEQLFAGYPMAPPRRRLSIRSGRSPSRSLSTASVCSPRSGAGLERIPSTPAILIGLPGKLTLPTCG